MLRRNWPDTRRRGRAGGKENYEPGSSGRAWSSCPASDALPGGARDWNRTRVSALAYSGFRGPSRGSFARRNDTLPPNLGRSIYAKRELFADGCKRVQHQLSSQRGRCASGAEDGRVRQLHWRADTVPRLSPRRRTGTPGADRPRGRRRHRRTMRTAPFGSSFRLREIARRRSNRCDWHRNFGWDLAAQVRPAANGVLWADRRTSRVTRPMRLRSFSFGG